MITIPTSEIKRFLSQANFLKGNNAIPILDYIKIDHRRNGTTMTKTNLESTVIADVEADGKEECVLAVQANALAAVVNTTFSDSIKIGLSEDSRYAIIDDGKIPTKSQAENVENFPSLEIPDMNKAVEIDKEVLNALSTAKTHCLPLDPTNPSPGFMNLVFIVIVNDDKYVFGTRGGIIYFKKVDNSLPELSLFPDVVNVISKYPMLKHVATEKYDFFQSVGVTYSFVKPETKAPQLSHIIAQSKSDNSFIIDRQDVINFCERAIALNTTAVVSTVSLEDAGKKSIKLRFTDQSDNNSCSEKIEVEEKTFEPEKFSFLPKNLVTVLKSTSASKVKVSRIPNNSVITSEEDPNYIGFSIDLMG